MSARQQAFSASSMSNLYHITHPMEGATSSAQPPVQIASRDKGNAKLAKVSGGGVGSGDAGSWQVGVWSKVDEEIKKIEGARCA